MNDPIDQIIAGMSEAMRLGLLASKVGWFAASDVHAHNSAGMVLAKAAANQGLAELRPCPMDDITDKLDHLIEKQRNARGDMLYMGNADPELIDARDEITALRAEIARLRRIVAQYADPSEMPEDDAAFATEVALQWGESQAIGEQP